ncbi:MAG: elongation factor G [Lachnospiraceae bacterium]|nr:elongation factor G [Lachnospiraceae bacterium]MBR6349145.1 elongation factor G [Lachnospiraceae bacterium]
MNVYKTENIRNVALLGHGGSGKTTLVESMALTTGIITRMGNINDGNTISDFDKEEIKRKFSISTILVPVEFNGVKINVLDAPGYFDFVGATEEAVSVCDGAVIVINAKSGLEVGAIKAWNLCEKYNIPKMIYVSGMDDVNADYYTVISSLKEQFGNKIAPFHIPIDEGGQFVGYVNVIRKAGRKFKADGSYDVCDVPADAQAHLDEYRNMIDEAVAETSEELMEKYFGGEEFTLDEIYSALKEAVTGGDLVPVMVGSSIKNLGAKMVLENIERYFPAPNESPVKKHAVNAKTDEEFELTCDPTKPLATYVFKTIMDPFIGKYSVVKVYSGVLTSDDQVFNAATDESEKISKLYIKRGKNFEEIKELQAGDIGAIGKLNLAKTGDTLSRKDTPIIIDKFEYSKPYTYMKYSAVNKGEEDKISQALQKLCAEDQTLKTMNDEENKQSLIYGIGDQQLDVVVSKMKDKYKVDITLDKPAFAFRETIRKSADVQGKHKKQSGGHGQYGDVRMIFEPLGNTEKAYEFEERVVGGSVPKNFFPAVEKGLQECVQRGPLANYPVVGVKAILYDGSYHPVDSNEMSFKMATILAFKKGFMEANPVLLEPIVSLKVTVPDRFTGDVMGDLNKRRGRVLGSNAVAPGITCIEADVPNSELYGYGTVLRSMTGGFGDFEYEFSRYEQAPADVQQKEVAARHTDDEE